jgi:hypothetical protein
MNLRHKPTNPLRIEYRCDQILSVRTQCTKEVFCHSVSMSVDHFNTGSWTFRDLNCNKKRSSQPLDLK